MMLSRCPACQTVFRVRAEQLRAHHGDVRCGRCQASFNALEHLLDENAPPAEVPAAATVPTRAPTPGDAASSIAAATSIGATPRTDAARPAPSAVGRALDDQFFILEERPSDPGRDRQDPPPQFPPPPFGDEAPTTAPSQARAPVIGSAFDKADARLDFEIPESLLAPRRPLRTSDLLRREPVSDKAVVERAAEDLTAPAPRSAPAGETSFPDFIDLPDLGAAEASGSAEAATEDLPHFGARVPFGEWAQRVRSEPGLASEAATPAEPSPATGRHPPSPPAPESAPPPAAFVGATDNATAAEPAIPANVIEEEVSAPGEVPPFGNASPFPVRAEDGLEAERLDATYGPPPMRPARRWLLGLGIGVLLGALAAQAAYVFRDEITRRWPQLRPAYLAACESFRCTVPLPRIAELIGIETSDLQSESGRAGRFILNATVRNRAPHPQAYPHLEVTLTDAQDRPLVRRVLEPKEWVPPRQLERPRVADGFPAGNEIALRLPFEAAGVAAVGYRLYVFYP